MKLHFTNDQLKNFIENSSDLDCDIGSVPSIACELQKAYSRITELEVALNKILKEAEQEFYNHADEFGNYDHTTNVTEFSEFHEDWSCALHERLEGLEEIIKPLLLDKGGE